MGLGGGGGGVEGQVSNPEQDQRDYCKRGFGERRERRGEQRREERRREEPRREEAALHFAQRKVLEALKKQQLRLCRWRAEVIVTSLLLTVGASVSNWSSAEARHGRRCPQASPAAGQRGKKRVLVKPDRFPLTLEPIQT